MRVLALPLLAPLFVLAYGALFLSSPASTNAYIPYALVTGPIALVGFFLLGMQSSLLWVLLAGTYALYLVYGIAVRAISRRGGSVGSFLMLIGVLHAACGMAFMYLALAG
jgi:hypothetical protein